MIVYLSPFTNTQNRYIELQKQLLAELGMDVRPLSVDGILRARCWGLFSRQNVVLVHWLENRVFRRDTHARGLSAVGLVSYLFYLLILVLCRARVVYFVHDHSVHDVLPRYRRLSRVLIAILRRVSDSRVVHDPSFAARYGASYLPHPLYNWGPRAQAVRARSAELPDADVRFAVLGALRPYKAIDRLLRAWPTGVHLLIAGKAEPSYLKLLNGVIAERGLETYVRIDARFIADEEFIALTSQQQVLVLPHVLDSMLVSGGFFEGIGRVPVILARRTPFFDWIRKRFPGVVTFDDDLEIPTKVRAIIDGWPSLRRLDATALAEREFGWSTCRDAYGRLLFERAPGEGAQKNAHGRRGVDGLARHRG